MNEQTSRLPALFLGHGNPMNALERNRYTEAWARLGAERPKPKAVLCVSAHWYIDGPAVTINTAPRTIHDFGGFPPELFAVQYPAPGDPALAERVARMLGPVEVARSAEWGLDHGTWAVLCHLFPEADVPVVQLSIDRRRPGQFHYEIGQRLAELREEGVLVVGSGNLVHNLRMYAWGRAVEPYAWAAEFEGQARELVLAGEHGPLIGYEALGRGAALAIPTPEHYLPLLYVLGAGAAGEAVSFPVEGIEGGSLSMLSVKVG